MFTLPSLHTANLRTILGIFWPRTISNRDLLAGDKPRGHAYDHHQKRWGWFGHVLRTDSGSITNRAVSWAPEGEEKERPTTRRRTVESELRDLGHSWGCVDNNNNNNNNNNDNFYKALYPVKSDELTALYNSKYNQTTT